MEIHWVVFQSRSINNMQEKVKAQEKRTKLYVVRVQINVLNGILCVSACFNECVCVFMYCIMYHRMLFIHFLRLYRLLKICMCR